MNTAVKLLAALLMVAVLAIVSVSWAMASRLVAPRQFPVGNPPAGLIASSVSFPSQSGSTLHGWNVPAQDSRGIVLLFHGIRASRISMQRRAKFLQANGYSSVLIDFQSHGESKGQAITVGHLEKFDVDVTLTFARSEYPDQPVGIIAVSMGGAATLFASPMGVKAVVLESVYPDIRSAVYNRVSQRLGSLPGLDLLGSVATDLLLWQLGPRLGIDIEQLKPLDYIDDLNSPVFIISGENDRYTTEAETQKLFDQARSPKALWLVEGAAHENLAKAVPEEYTKRVLEFLDQYL